MNPRLDRGRILHTTEAIKLYTLLELLCYYSKIELTIEKVQNADMNFIYITTTDNNIELKIYRKQTKIDTTIPNSSNHLTWIKPSVLITDY